MVYGYPPCKKGLNTPNLVIQTIMYAHYTSVPTLFLSTKLKYINDKQLKIKNTYVYKFKKLHICIYIL